MWSKHAHTLYPPTKLCSTKVKFKWTDINPKLFMAMKKIVVRGVLFSYPDFSEKFVIYTDARKRQIDDVIIQNGKTISFY